MKKTMLILLVVLIQSGCRKEHASEPAFPPSTVNGLELTFCSTNPQNNFKSVYFLNEYTGYAAGLNGIIYKTSDGNVTWSALNSGTTLPLYDIYFLDSNEGFAVGGESGCGGSGCVPYGAIILHTTNSGQTWNMVPLSLSETIELKSVCFVNDTLGFAVGNNMILTTTDRGLTWQEKTISNPGGTFSDVKFINEQKGLIACTYGKLLKTTDGGINWNISSPFPSVGNYVLSFVNENLIFAAGYTKVMQSTDFGNTWTDLPDYPADVFELVFKSANTGYAFGRGIYSGGDFSQTYGAIYYTTDGGNTWTGNNSIHETTVIESASFPTEHVGFAVSRNVIVKIKRL